MGRRAVFGVVVALLSVVGLAVPISPAGALPRSDGVLAVELSGVTSGLPLTVSVGQSFSWFGPGELVMTSGPTFVGCGGSSGSWGSVVTETSGRLPLTCQGTGLLGFSKLDCDLWFSRYGTAIVLTGNCTLTALNTTYPIRAAGTLAWTPLQGPPVQLYQVTGAVALTKPV